MQNPLPSASQNQLKKWTKLLQAKFRAEDRLFLAEGIKVVEELLQSDWPVEAILVLPEKASLWEKLIILPDSEKPIHGNTNLLHPSFPRRRESSPDESFIDSRLRGNDTNIPVYALSRSDFKKLSQDKEPEGIIAVVQLKDPVTTSALLKEAASRLLVAHEISNPSNLGALLRTARWFGFKGIVLGNHCVDWTHPKAIRTSMGAAFHLTICPDVDLSDALSEMKQRYQIIGSDVRKGGSPRPIPGDAALLVGSESHGLPEDLLKLANERWRIQGDAQAESLSLPQAAAIMMYEMSKKM